MNDFDSQDDKAYTDQLFARLSSIEPSAKLSRTVAQIPIEYPRSVLSFLPFKSAWQPVFALAAAAAVGFFSGQSFLDLRAENAPAQLAALDEAADELVPSPEETGAADELAEADAIDEELEGLLLLASAGDFESDDWGDSLESSANDTQSEEGTF
jgi:hypothetical protein